MLGLFKISDLDVRVVIAYRILCSCGAEVCPKAPGPSNPKPKPWPHRSQTLVPDLGRPEALKDGTESQS